MEIAMVANKKTATPAKRPRGRPTGYSVEIGDKICERLTNGDSLRKITQDSTMPSSRAVMRWLVKYEDFRHQYAEAREFQAEHYADAIVEIADNATAENVNAARLQIDARKWVASKLLPKKYGDRQNLNHSGGIAIKKAEDMSVEELAAALGEPI